MSIPSVSSSRSHPLPLPPNRKAPTPPNKELPTPSSTAAQNSNAENLRQLNVRQIPKGLVNCSQIRSAVSKSSAQSTVITPRAPAPNPAPAQVPTQVPHAKPASVLPPQPTQVTQTPPKPQKTASLAPTPAHPTQRVAEQGKFEVLRHISIILKKGEKLPFTDAELESDEVTISFKSDLICRPLFEDNEKITLVTPKAAASNPKIDSALGEYAKDAKLKGFFIIDVSCKKADEILKTCKRQVFYKTIPEAFCRALEKLEFDKSLVATWRYDGAVVCVKGE